MNSRKHSNSLAKSPSRTMFSALWSTHEEGTIYRAPTVAWRWLRELFDGDGFGEVARLIDVAAAADGDVIGKKLEGDDFEERHEKFGRGGQFDDVTRGGAGEMVAGGDDGDDDAVACADFMHIRNGFFVEGDGGGVGIVARGENDDGKIFVDEGVGAVLHFAGGIAFGVDVRNFLELEGAFEGDGIVNAATEIEKIGATKKLAGEIFVKTGFLGLQNRFHFVGNPGEFLEKVFCGVGGERAANFAEMHGEEEKRGEL